MSSLDSCPSSSFRSRGSPSLGKKLTSSWNGREIASVASKEVTKSWSVECGPISNSKPTVDMWGRGAGATIAPCPGAWPEAAGRSSKLLEDLFHLEAGELAGPAGVAVGGNGARN